MASQPRSDSNSVAVLERLRRAINRHDLDSLAACFEFDFSGEFPAHPGRDVRGHEQQRRHWARTFAAVPDIRATLVRNASEGETAWAEWEWMGTRATDGAPFVMRGVTVQGVRRDRISWSRLYMEPVRENGAGGDGARRATRPEPTRSLSTRCAVRVATGRALGDSVDP